MMNIQKAVIAWAKMCETDLDRVTSTFIDLTLNFQHGSVPDSKVNIFVRLNGLHFVT